MPQNVWKSQNKILSEGNHTPHNGYYIIPSTQNVLSAK